MNLCTVLEDIAKGIVDHPEEVKVTQDEEPCEDGSINLILSVAESDMGMIIGKHGKIARAIRTVMKAAARTTDQKINVEIK